MQILSRCPLRVGSILWLSSAGTCALTVVCKATFRLAPEVSPLADDQVEVFETDEYFGGNEAGSLIRATDLVPFKRQPEVLLTGHVYAPKGVHVGQLIARMTVAEIDKAIEVTGDRHFKLDGTLSHPARFAKMPLVWERAAGGADSANPVGVLTGPDTTADGWGRIAVPNLVSQGRIVSERSEVIAPACFGPLAPLWPARLHRLHRHATSFSPHAWHARPLPSDFDGAYFNAAPQDQLVHELLGSERLTLENLHPQHALLSTKLAGVKPRAHADFGSGGTFEVPLACDTLWIDTDLGVATVTFRGSMSLDYPEREGWVVVTMEGHEHVYSSPNDGYTAYSSDAQPGVYASGAAGPLDAWMGRVRDVNETMAFDGDEEARGGAALPAALPFSEQDGAFESSQTGDFDDEVTYAGDRSVRTPSAAAVPKVPTGPRLGAFQLRSPAPPPPSAEDLDFAATVDPDDVSVAKVHAALAALPAHVASALSGNSGATALPGVPALPLPGAPAPPIPGAPVPPVRVAPAPPSRPALPFQPIEEDTFDPAEMTAGLPFVGAPKPAGSSGLPFSSAPRDDAMKTPREEAASTAVAASAMPFVQPRAPGMTIGEMVAQSRAPLPIAKPVTSVHIDSPSTFVPESTKDVPPTGETPPPPALLGPLATPEMVAAEHEDAPTGDAAFADTGQGDAAAPAEEAPPEPEAPKEPEPLPLDKFPIDKCARIAASIARTRDKEASILEAHELRQDVWERLKAHYAAEIKKETERGKTALLRVYDAAYVSQLENERGPIAVEEYARLVVAAERGTAPQTLTELSLPDSAMLRIQRVWMIKMGQDPELRRLVRSAVELKSDE